MNGLDWSAGSVQAPPLQRHEGIIEDWEETAANTNEDIELGSMSDSDTITDDEETGLTKQDKMKRKRERKRNTQMDQRVVRSPAITAQERKDADQSVLKRMLANGLLISLW
jgi:solute carrier family 35 protein C2